MAELIEKKSLRALLPPQAIVSQLEAGFIAEPSGKEELLRVWENANRNYKSVGPASRSFTSPDDTREIDVSVYPDISSVMSQIGLYQPFDTHKGSLCYVRTTKLVTPQIEINTSRADQRVEDLNPNISEKDLISLMLGLKGKFNPINRQALGFASNGGSIIYTSYDEDIRIYHPPQYRSLTSN
jgi:hypothetical protein